MDTEEWVKSLNLLAKVHFRIINGINIDYNFKWKVNTNVSVTLKIAITQFMADVGPAKLIPIVNKAGFLDELFEF